eukprot:4123715-Amphidinium_carterae.1
MCSRTQGDVAFCAPPLVCNTSKHSRKRMSACGAQRFAFAFVGFVVLSHHHSTSHRVGSDNLVRKLPRRVARRSP